MGFYNLFNEGIDLYLRNIRLFALPPPILSSTFDLIVLDGHFLFDTYVTPKHEAPVHRWDTDRLLVSQIIIGLQSVMSGGTIIIKLRHPESYSTAAMLYMLDQISTSLELVKPLTMHGNRGTFYAIAKGVGISDNWEKKEEYLYQFRRLWYEITFGGPNGQGRFLLADGEKDLNFIASYDQLRTGYTERLAELSKDVWRIQAEALDHWFRRKGVLA